MRGGVRVSPNSKVKTLNFTLYTVECTLHYQVQHGIVLNLKGTRPRQSVPNSGFHLVGPGLILVNLV